MLRHEYEHQERWQARTLRQCFFGLLEIVTPLVVGALASAGVGATTAGAIGAFAAPALVGAGAGALVGAGGELIKGGKPFKGMLSGAKIGGELGAAYGAPGALSQAFPETMTGLGLAPATATLGADGTYATGPGGFAASTADGLPGGALSAAQATGLDPATLDAYGVPQGGALSAASGANPLASASSAAAKGLGGFSTTDLALGALNGLLQHGANQTRTPNYGLAPGPSTTSATLGPMFNQPLQTSGYLNRTQTPNYQPTDGWYRYGESGGQMPFWSNNKLNFNNGNVPMARGGALSRAMRSPHTDEAEFDTGRGDFHVGGEGGGQEDNISAKLSPGEVVFDSGTVSAVGDGNNAEGARRLLAMRKQIAEDKGFKHTVQPKLKKSPLQYLYDTKKKRAA